jgi:Protein of unknown function (DUF3562)
MASHCSAFGEAWLFKCDYPANSCQKNLTVMINVEVASPVALASNWYINPLRRNWVNFDKFSGPYSANGKLDGQKNHGVAHRKKEGSDSMSEQAFNLPADADAGANAGADTDAEIELLACETHMSRELVKIVYSSERAKLERTARIKTYIPVLVHCRVKALLRRRA